MFLKEPFAIKLDVKKKLNSFKRHKVLNFEFPTEHFVTIFYLEQLQNLSSFE
jgi:hypothetical protein